MTLCKTTLRDLTNINIPFNYQGIYELILSVSDNMKPRNMHYSRLDLEDSKIGEHVLNHKSYL